MGYDLIIELEAQKEIDEAVFWYESKQNGLGRIFLDYLEGYFKTLTSGKILFPVKRRPYYRELPLKRFPYIIIFEIHKSVIIVYSVFNTHQDPDKKRR